MDKRKTKTLLTFMLRRRAPYSIIEFEHNIANSKLDVKINRPLSAFHAASRSDKRGLILCHGHNHSSDIIKDFPDVNYWYTVDSNYEAYPDYQADVTSKRAMSYFPENYFDVVIIAHYPIGIYKELYLQILENIRQIVKPIGLVHTSGLKSMYHLFLIETDYDKLKNRAMEIVSVDNFDHFKKKTNEIRRANNDKIYDLILRGKYEGPNKVTVNALISRLAWTYVKKILRKIGYKIVFWPSTTKMISIRPMI